MSFNEMNEKCVKLKRKQNHIFENVMYLLLLVSHLLFFEAYGSFYLDLTEISGIIAPLRLLPLHWNSFSRIPFCFDAIYFYSFICAQLFCFLCSFEFECCSEFSHANENPQRMVKTSLMKIILNLKASISVIIRLESVLHVLSRTRNQCGCVNVFLLHSIFSVWQ